jgi:RHS repeat-associated protein
VSWLLGDARDVTATATNGGTLDDLVAYGDFGNTSYATTGWKGAVGYDGQPSDATLGTSDYYARNYDPSLGSWLQADTWRGQQDDPQSLNRYAYVKNSPVTYADAFGFVHLRVSEGTRSVRLAAVANQARRNNVGLLNLTNRRNSSVGSFSIPALASLQKASRGPAVKSTVRKPASRSAQTTALRHVATTTGCTASDWSCRNGCVFSYTTCDTKPSPAVKATPPLTIACGRDMKVGTSPGQVAINEACGRAYAEANIRTQEKWVQDLWDLTQGIDRAVRPAVPLLTASAGAAGWSGRSPYSTRPNNVAAQSLPWLPPSAPTPLGRGVTGRGEPQNSYERFAMTEVRSNPSEGTALPITVWKDERWPLAQGWRKMARNVNGIEIHWMWNRLSGEVDDFKFK